MATSISQLAYGLSLRSLTEQESAWEANQAVIDTLFRAFWWACVALVAAVVLWSAGLAIE